MNNKVKTLQNKLKERNLDGAVIYSRPNTIYFSGFLGTTSAIFITHDEAIFATDFRYMELASGLLGDEFKLESANVSPSYVGKKVMELGLETVGFEEEAVSYSLLMNWAEQAPEVEFVGIQSDISRMRMIKAKAEIDIIQKAVDIGDAAFSHILEMIKPGVTEIEVAAELEYFMRKSGAIKPSFETIAVSGTKTSMPHGMPENKKIELGDPFTMDFGCVVEGYCSDMTRTVFVGTPSKEMKDIYDLVLNTQIECQERAFAGMTGIEVDAISRKMIYGAG
ncbi:MAG: Xaa-Pro peptidase family protein, partial [Clostridia bacterium]|nr:Xaa-Pro peptidase family protein [Clostridia bacterium]